MSIKPFTSLADELAKRCSALDSWEDIREDMHFASGGDLDCTQLDILTDMVFSRVQKNIRHLRRATNPILHARETQRQERAAKRSRRAWEILDVLTSRYFNPQEIPCLQCHDSALIKEAQDLITQQKKEARITDPLGIRKGKPAS